MPLNRPHHPKRRPTILRFRKPTISTLSPRTHNTHLIPPHHRGHKHQHLLPRQKPSGAKRHAASERSERGTATQRQRQRVVPWERKTVRIEGRGAVAEESRVQVQLAVRDEKLGAGAQRFAPNDGVAQDFAGSAGVGHEAEDFEEDGFHAGTVVEDLDHGRGAAVVVGRAESERDFGGYCGVQGWGLEDESEVPEG